MISTKTKVSTRVKVGLVIGGLAIAAGAAGVAGLVSRIAPQFALSSASPSGDGFIPGFQEAFRFNVTAKASDITINSLIFKLNSTDNATTSSLWNTCFNLSDSSKWAIYNASTSGTASSVADSWDFLNAGMRPCTGNQIVSYAIATFSAETILAYGTSTYLVYMDSTGASASADDSIQLSIPKIGKAVSWTDDKGFTRNAALVKVLPLTGGVMGF